MHFTQSEIPLSYTSQATTAASVLLLDFDPNDRESSHLYGVQGIFIETMVKLYGRAGHVHELE
jgi:hypothetical protein